MQAVPSIRRNAHKAHLAVGLLICMGGAASLLNGAAHLLH